MTNAPVYPLATDSWGEAEYAALQETIASKRFTMGPRVEAFEAAAAEFFGARYAVMVNSGSSANLLAIAGLVYHPDAILKSGDEVIVPAVSWSTTYYPLQQYGMKPRFVDVSLDTLNLDMEKLEAAITPATRAVLAVNLLGNPANLPELKALCDSHGLILIEDNCESMGAKAGGRYAGTFGICGTFSTFFSHHISTMEGGFILTDDKVLRDTLVSLRAHGWVREQPADTHLEVPADPFMQMFRFVLPGYNVRPLEMSGALGCEQLKKLPKFVSERRANAVRFAHACGNINGYRIQRECGESSWFGFSLILEGHLQGKRNQLADLLGRNQIDCRPIVAGNFLNNPVIRYFDYSVGSSMEAADEVDNNGIFVGNHHYPIEEGVGLLARLLKEFSQSQN